MTDSQTAGRRFLTPEEAADELGLNVETIRRHCRDGTLPAIKIGRSWRVDMQRLAEQVGQDP